MRWLLGLALGSGLIRLGSAWLISFRPETGFFLAALLLAGWRVAPGLVAGALLASWMIGEPWGGAVFQTVASLTGAALGWRLARRRGWPVWLHEKGQIVFFHTRLAPLAGLAGMLPALWARQAGWIGHDGRPASLFALIEWVGQGLGVALVTPLVLACLANFGPWPRRRWGVAVPGLFMTAQVLVGLALVIFWRERWVRAEVRRRGERAVQSFHSQLRAQKELLGVVGSFYRSSRQVTEAEFRTFATGLNNKGSGLRALIWIAGPRRLLLRYPGPGRPEPTEAEVVAAFAAGSERACVCRLGPGERQLCWSLGLSEAPGAPLVGALFSLQETLDAALAELPEDPRVELALYPAGQTGGQEPLARAGVSGAKDDFSGWFQEPLAEPAGMLSVRVLRQRFLFPQPVLPFAVFTVVCLQISLLLLSSQSLRIEVLKNEGERRAESLARLNRELERAARAQSLFLATMSHEIRTPLNAVVGLSQLALADQGADSSRLYLSHAVESGRSLLGIVDQVLDYSRIEAGELVLAERSFRLEAVFDRVLQTLALQAEEKGLELVGWLAPGVPDEVVGDEIRLGQVLINLVGNAVKYTGSGFVELGVECLDRDSDGVWLRYRVRDSGPGIAAEDRERIFEVYAQPRAGLEDPAEGVGLGLSIARDLVRLMGGSLEVQSAPERGSEFRFELLQTVSGAPAPPFAAGFEAGAHPVEIGLVSVKLREALQRMLERWGFPVLAAGTAPEAVRIAELEGSPAGPGIALVALGRLAEQVAMCRTRGVRPLVRPVTSRALRFALLQAWQALPVGEEGTARCPGRTGKALVVDDVASNRALARALLEQRGFQVDCLAGGRQVWEHEQNWDLVLLDGRLSDGDGCQVAVELRRHGFTAPILAVSGAVDPSSRQRARDCGMDGFLGKPLRADELSRLLGWLERAPQDGELDRLALWRALDGDPRACLLLSETLLAELPVLCREVRDAPDPAGLARACHSLAGAVQVFGAEALIEAAGRLQKLAETERTDEFAAPLAELERSCADFERSLFHYWGELQHGLGGN